MFSNKVRPLSIWPGYTVTVSASLRTPPNSMGRFRDALLLCASLSLSICFAYGQHDISQPLWCAKHLCCDELPVLLDAGCDTKI